MSCVGNILICEKCGSEWIDYIPYWHVPVNDVLSKAQIKQVTPLTTPRKGI